MKQAATVCAAGATVEGLDVWEGYGNIDWSQVKGAGKQFVIVRIGDGLYQDAKFSANWPAVKANGFIRGSYQYFRTGDDPTAQANIVVASVGKLGDGDLPVAADVEEQSPKLGPAAYNAALHTWANAVEQGTGKKPMIYTGKYYWDPYVATGDFSSYTLWHAQYTTASCPNIADEWSTWGFWQYAADPYPGIPGGTCPGISGWVDLDVFNGDAAALAQLAGGSVQCTGPIGHPVGKGGKVSGPCGSAPNPPAPTACGALASGQGLLQGKSVSSCDGRFALDMQTDGNLVLYSHGIALWNTGTNGNTGAAVVMQADGNLVIYSSTGCPLWASNTSGKNGATLAVQDDGNLVVYSGSTAVWATGTGSMLAAVTSCGGIPSGHALEPGGSVSSCGGCFDLVMQSDGNLVLYQQGGKALWSTGTAGQHGYAAEMLADGDFTLYSNDGCTLWQSSTKDDGARLAVQDDGNLVVYSSTNSALWASGTNVCKTGCYCNPDAGTPAGRDAATPAGPDAAAPAAPDAAASAGPDAGQHPRDASSVAHADAQAVAADAQEGGLDSGSEQLSDAAQGVDSSSPKVGSDSGSCGCGAASSSGLGLAGLLAFGAVARRRRTRRVESTDCY